MEADQEQFYLRCVLPVDEESVNERLVVIRKQTSLLIFSTVKEWNDDIFFTVVHAEGFCDGKDPRS